MNKDIDFSDIQGVGVAIVNELNLEGHYEWNVYLLNLKNEALTDVMISGSGFGEKDGKQVRTTTLRYFIGNIGAMDYRKVEPIMEELFEVNNSYLLSFYIDGEIHDRKITFEAGSIIEENLETVPLINQKGVLGI